MPQASLRGDADRRCGLARASSHKPRGYATMPFPHLGDAAGGGAIQREPVRQLTVTLPESFVRYCCVSHGPDMGCDAGAERAAAKPQLGNDLPLQHPNPELGPPCAAQRVDPGGDQRRLADAITPPRATGRSVASPAASSSEWASPGVPSSPAISGSEYCSTVGSPPASKTSAVREVEAAGPPGSPARVEVDTRLFNDWRSSVKPARGPWW